MFFDCVTDVVTSQAEMKPLRDVCCRVFAMLAPAEEAAAEAE